MLEIRGLKKVYNPGTVTEMTLFDGFDLRDRKSVV